MHFPFCLDKPPQLKACIQLCLAFHPRATSSRLLTMSLLHSAAAQANRHLFSVTLTGCGLFNTCTPTQTRCASHIGQITKQPSHERGSRHLSVEWTLKQRQERLPVYRKAVAAALSRYIKAKSWNRMVEIRRWQCRSHWCACKGSTTYSGKRRCPWRLNCGQCTGALDQGLRDRR